MKKIKYLVDSLIIDLRENGRLTLFSAVLAFVGLFFAANIEKIVADIQIFSLMKGTYFLSVNNEECSEKKLQMLEKDLGIILHSAEYFAVNIDGNYAECYLYDNYIMKHLNYNFCEGKKIEKEDEVILSAGFSDRYETGDCIVISGHDKNNNYIEKEKTVCGFLKDNRIYYPHGTGDKVYDLLMIDVGDTGDGLYYPDAVICTDSDFGSQSLDGGIATYMLELSNDSDKEEVKDAITDIGYMYSGEELIAQNEKTLRYERNQKKIFVIAGLTLGLSIFMGSIYVSIVKRKKEFGIMMLTGATFKGALILVRIPGVIAALVGSILGEGIAIQLIRKGVLEGEWYYDQALLVVGIIILLYMLCCIILERIWNKKSIVDLIERG